jgi:hypothetical protein
MEELIEALKKAKALCMETDCSECPLSVGIYQEGPDFIYYSCDIRKKPKDWDLDKERMKQDKNYKKNKEKEEKKKSKEKTTTKRKVERKSTKKKDTKKKKTK